MKTFKVRIRDTESTVFDGEADRISSFNEMGPFDIYAMHANFISILPEIKEVNTRHYATIFRSCFLGLAFDRCLSYGLNTEELLAIYQNIYSQIKLKF